jgi:ABC-2 type transport system permease protein
MGDIVLGAGPRRTRVQRAARQAGIVGAYFAQFLKTRLAYRADFLVDLGANLFAIAVQLTTLTVIFSKVPELKGWTFDQVLFIYGFSLVPSGLFNIVSINLYRFAEHYIADGNLDRVLLRPINALAQVMFESFNLTGLNEMILGTGIVVFAGSKLGLTVGPVDVLVFLLVAPSAALIYAAVFLGLSSVSFWFEDRMGLAPPIYNVIRFSRYPLTIYGRWVQAFLTFVLPFAWVAYMPATWFVGDADIRAWALLTPVVALLVGSLSYGIWRAGVRRYASTGS